ncbi:UNVERIFIED_CONTAM: hypothetical protein DES50_11167 [Williamsia faeni]
MGTKMHSARTAHAPKLGKLPARPGAAKLRLSTYLDTSVLPKPPAEFGHEGLVSSWGMLGNDSWGDCVWAGAGHEIMLWNAEAQTTVAIDADATLHNYSQVTGFDPNAGAPGHNPTDQGTDMEKAARYRRRTGFIDANGHRHKIGAYVALRPGNLNDLWYATYLFDGVGIGVEFPAQWMDAFNEHRPWDSVAHPTIEGGHYITSVAKKGGTATIVTWGCGIPLTAAGYQQFNDESLAYFSEEKLLNGKDVNGFDIDALRADLAALANP